MPLFAVRCSDLLGRGVSEVAPQGKLARDKPTLPRTKPDASTCTRQATLKRRKTRRKYLQGTQSVETANIKPDRSVFAPRPNKLLYGKFPHKCANPVIYRNI